MQKGKKKIFLFGAFVIIFFLLMLNSIVKLWSYVFDVGNVNKNYLAAGVVIFAWKRYICKKPIGKWFKTGCVVCVVLMVIYYVWRMYRYFPDQPPMSYYHYNLLRLLMDVAFGALK